MPDPIDVSQLVPPEGAAPEGQPQPEPEPQPEEFYEIKYRGEVRQVPKSTIDAIAPALETTPEGVINAFQRAREADRISREKIRLEQELERLRQQNDGARYQEQMGGGPAPQPTPYRAPQPQYAPPQYYQTPPQYPQQEEDPVALIRRLQQGVELTQRQMTEFMQAAAEDRQRAEQERREAIARQQAQQIEAQAERYLAEKNKSRKEPIDLRDFLEEAELSGGLNARVPLETVFDRAYTWMTRDEIYHQAQADQMAKLRDPRARVVVPASPAATPPPPQPTGLDALGDMKWGEMIQNIPERR